MFRVGIKTPVAKPAAQQPAANWKEVFVAALAKSPNVSAAAKKAKINRQYAYVERGRDADFAAAWDDALEAAIDDLEGTAWQRAKKRSDVLLIFLLKAHRPEKYRETVRNEHSGPGGSDITIKVVYGDERVDS